jgi:hypothetical protein
MIKYKEGSIKFADMGYIYTSNQEILSMDVAFGKNGQTMKLKEYFQFDNTKSRNKNKIKVMSKIFRTKFFTLINEFVILLTPNKSLSDIADPVSDNLKKIKALHDGFLDILNKFVSATRITYPLILFILKNIHNSKEIANYYIKDLILDSGTNMLVNSYIFSRPSIYFPGKIEVPVDEFVDVYMKNLIHKIFWIKQNDVIKGTFIEHFRITLDDMAKQYADTLEQIEYPNRETYSLQFKNKLMDFSKIINTNRFFITPSMEIRLKNSITSYLISLYQNPRFEKVNLFRQSSNMINIHALNEVYQVFSIDRDIDADYAVRTPVFDILSDEDSQDEENAEELL